MKPFVCIRNNVAYDSFVDTRHIVTIWWLLWSHKETSCLILNNIDHWRFQSHLAIWNKMVYCELYVDIRNHLGLYEPYVVIGSTMWTISRHKKWYCKTWIYLDIWNSILWAIWTMSRGKKPVEDPLDLTHFSAMFHFYTPENIRKPLGFFWRFQGLEMKHWAKMS